MSWIRDRLRQDIQDDLVELVETEVILPNHSKVTKATLSAESTNPDTVEDLRNKCSLPIAKKKIKLL